MRLAKLLLIILIIGMIGIWLMVDFWGWIGIVGTLGGIIGGAVIAIGLMNWQELRTQNSRFTQTTQELNNLNVFLRRITLSQIQEKIAVLHDYPTQIPEWKSDNIIRYKTDRMISDIRAIQEVRTLLRDNQIEEIHTIRDDIANAMSGKQEFLSRINAAFQIVFSPSS
jgi:hypothetical protein